MDSNSPFITLTGLDESMPLVAVREFASMPEVEVGLQLAASQQPCPRYPSLSWLRLASRMCCGSAALHVCGSQARRWLSYGDIPCITDAIDRIQVNGVIGAACMGVDDIEALCVRYPHATIITQHCSGNEDLLSVQSKNHALLVDASLWHGCSVHRWSRPDTDKAVGFAVRLAASALPAALARIDSEGEGRSFWLDIESGLQDANDHFDIGHARRIVSIFREWRANRAGI